ncbi:ABC transporter ATP-binding protein [Leptospira congkakensis]|uniref:ABC transporter ATP-binding protein n=1 Tax=Leptospira congkakensis TaxID=2484932 RepID=A0A4Z1A621_9LEPT|nr:ABC transporter ATP-binding protein [Leptospira congkakensis]TGL86409.1 ABC transporter ATP-binding protein [Leptospira congkakensis]TGL94045.1 ABC transporter ATP-binding protein [Leptospira congkakensis]TGL94550.1 ABC transporter ATP-binding protein [Leptospira congkakensis]
MLKFLRLLVFHFKNQLFKAKEESFDPRLSSHEDLAKSVLDFLSESLHIHSVPSQIIEGFRSLRSKYRILTNLNFYDFLFAASHQYQIRLNLVQKTLQDIRSYITQDSPFVFQIPSDDHNLSEFYAIISYQTSSYLVKPLHGFDNEGEWYSEKELMKFIGIKSNKDSVDWIIAEPTFPFSTNKEVSGSYSAVKNALKQISHLIRMESKDVWIVFIYGIGIGILSLVVPVATSSLVNIVAFGVLIQPVIILTLLVVFFLGFAGAMQTIQIYVVEILQRRVFVRIATEFAVKFPKIRQDVLDKHHNPELVNRFFDTMTIQKSIHSLLVDGLSVVLTTVIGFVLISFYHPIFIVFSFLILFIGGYWVTYRLGKPAAENYIKISKEKYKVAAWLEEISRHSALFHSTFGSNFALDKADSFIRDYLYARKKYFFNYIRQIIGLVGIQALASAIVLGLGGYLVIHRQLTIGQLVAAELVIAKVLSDISKFGKQLDSFYSLIAAVDKINSVFHLPTIPVKTVEFEIPEGPIQVQLSGIHYSLTNGHKIFNRFDLKVTPGKSIGISSNTPYDAHILLDLICGMRTPTSGIVEYNHQNIHEVSKEQIHSFTFLIRGNEIFEGTILENIRVGREEISLIEIRQLLEELGIWETIQSLPNGIHTPLLTFGHPFDNIQTTIISLARAIIGKPKLLLIDENLDILPPHLLAACLKVLLQKNKNWTLLIVSKSSNVLSQMDQVLRLENDSHSLKVNS